MRHAIRKSTIAGNRSANVLMRAHHSCPWHELVASAIAAFAAIAAACTPLGAQSSDYGPIVLRLPASAHVAAMANAGVGASDADALFYNPAMLNTARGVAISVQRFGSASTAGSLANVTPLGSTNVAIGVQLLTWSSASGAYSTRRRPGDGELFSRGGMPASSTAVTIGVARTFKGLRLGLGAKYAEERIAQFADGTAAIDAGFTMPLGAGNLSMAVQNLGGTIDINTETIRVPTRAAIGWGTPLAPRWLHWDVGFQSELAVERGGTVRGAAGVEAGYVPIEGVDIVLRFGAETPRDRAEAIVTGGVGFTLDRLSLDYAIIPCRAGVPASHRLAFRVR